MKTFTQFLAEKDTFSGKMYGSGKPGQTPGKMWANSHPTLVKPAKPFSGLNVHVIYKNGRKPSGIVGN